MSDFAAGTVPLLAVCAFCCAIVFSPHPTPIQDLPEPEPTYPSVREAHVSSVRDTNKTPARGGLLIHLAFEDDLEPEHYTIIADRNLFDRVLTGDLFYVHFNPDRTVIKWVGPIKE